MFNEIYEKNPNVIMNSVTGSNSYCYGQSRLEPVIDFPNTFVDTCIFNNISKMKKVLTERTTPFNALEKVNTLHLLLFQMLGMWAAFFVYKCTERLVLINLCTCDIGQQEL